MRGYKKASYLAMAIWLTLILAHSAIHSTVSIILFNGGVLQKALAFQQTAAPCKIWLIGSSPVFFGLQASKIQATTHCMTINFGLNRTGGDLLDDYLQSLLPYIRSGDIVILCDRRWLDLSRPGDHSFKFHSIPRLFKNLSMVPNLRSDAGSLPFAKIEKRTEYGDLEIFPPPAKPFTSLDGTLLFSPKNMGLMKNAQAVITAVGATALLVSPPTLLTEKTKQGIPPKLARIERQVATEMGAGVWLPPLLETDHSLFSTDSEHSSAEGRQRWTDYLTRALLARQTPKV